MHTPGFAEGGDFLGERVNDIHLINAQKVAATNAVAVDEAQAGAG